MENKKRKKKPPKPKQKFTLCCFCLNSSSSDIDLKVPLEDDETYEYVVEKLAIKKVPISLFATDEDLAEMREINEASDYTGDYPFTAKDKKSAVVFSSCYSKIPKSGRSSRSDNQIKKSNRKVTLKSSGNTPKFMRKMSSAKNVKARSDSCEYQSLDVVLLENKNRQEFPVSADVHSEPSMNIKSKKFQRLTPELQETLQELGSKPRPKGHPGVKPRTISRTNNEITVASQPPANETANIFNKIAEQIFQAEIPHPTSEMTTTDRPPISESVFSKPSKPEVEPTNEISRALSFHQKILKRLFPSQHKTTVQTSEEKVFSESESLAKPSDSNDIGRMLRNFATKSGLSQKWKIIIKEHEGEDNDKDKDVITTQPESSDSSSDYSSETETVSETD